MTMDGWTIFMGIKNVFLNFYDIVNKVKNFLEKNKSYKSYKS